MSINQNLEKLSNACGVTGRESQVRDLIVELLKPYADEIQLDKLENVIAIKKGKPNKPKIMLAAHMDEIGLMVKTITKDGFLQFSKMGGIDDRVLLAQKVNVYTNKQTYPGIIGSKPPPHPKRGRTQKNRKLRRTIHRRRRNKQRRRTENGISSRRLNIF